MEKHAMAIVNILCFIGFALFWFGIYRPNVERLKLYEYIEQPAKNLLIDKVEMRHCKTDGAVFCLTDGDYMKLVIWEQMARHKIRGCK